MRWIGLVLVAACGAKAPAPVTNAYVPPQSSARITRSAPRVAVAQPRPDLDLGGVLPDFHEELRWPLSGMSHPELEPQYPVARELAIDLEWAQLCERNVHKRVSATHRELLAYLSGWCEVQRRNIDGACAYFKPLIGSVKRGLTGAVRHDLANILSEQGAENAEHWLSKHDIRDVEVLDLLAANFVEVGSSADAQAINRRAIDSDNYATDATKCRRLVRHIVLAQEADPTLALQALKHLATAPKLPDPTCVRMLNKVSCWRAPQSSCGQYFADENIDVKAHVVVDAYLNWPRETGYDDWWAAADRALHGLPFPGAAELVITAYEASFRADSYCYDRRSFAVHHAISLIRNEPAHAVYADRLADLEKRCAKPALPAASRSKYTGPRSVTTPFLVPPAVPAPPAP